jgi:hypothetical protein
MLSCGAHGGPQARRKRQIAEFPWSALPACVVRSEYL